jgi:curli biogenesis system outer membrane secretion channel CsgG
VRKTVAALALAALAGCGLETTGAAASGAAIKKQELEQGQKTMEQAKQKIDRALEQQRLAQPAEDSAEK